jgi:hypothetical protein
MRLACCVLVGEAGRGPTDPDAGRSCRTTRCQGASATFPRRSACQVAQAREVLGEVRLPVIRRHDLRHAHGSATITLTVHQHVHPDMGREAADRFAALLEGSSGSRSITGVSRGPQEPRQQDTPGS